MEQEIANLFRSLDTDGNGVISLDELRRVLSAIGVSENDIRIIAVSMDTNRDGMISYDEFLRWTYQEPDWTKSMKQAARVEPAAGPVDRNRISAALCRISEQINNHGMTLETFFRLGDTDNNGFLSWEELWALVKKVDPTIPEDVLQGIFNELDRDMNGWLSLRELGAALTRADGGGVTNIAVATSYAPTLEELSRREACLLVLDLRAQVDKMDQTMYQQGYLQQQPAQRRWMDLRKMSVQEVSAEEPVLKNALLEMHDLLQAKMSVGVLRQASYDAAVSPSSSLSSPTQSHSAALLAEGNLLLLDRDLGLSFNRKWFRSSCGPAREDHRDNVRMRTRAKVAQELGLPQFGDFAKCIQRWPPYCKECKLFVDASAFAQERNAAAGGNRLLSRYDAFVSKAHADFDKDWKAVVGPPSPFWVCHMAPLNVGEMGTFDDFVDFANTSGLDEARYLNSMNRIFDNMVVVSVTLGVNHLVLPPFGLGTYMRHLHAIDRRYTDELAQQRLRRQLAERLSRSLTKTNPGTQIHFCLSDSDRETQCNSDAMMRTLMGQGQSMKARLTIWPDADCLTLAHELASSGQSVMLLNPTSRRLVGNHWFARRTNRGLDEDLHRRSWTMAAQSYVVNDFSTDNSSSADRKSTELRANVEWLGGQTYMFS